MSVRLCGGRGGDEQAERSDPGSLVLERRAGSQTWIKASGAG